MLISFVLFILWKILILFLIVLIERFLCEICLGIFLKILMNCCVLILFFEKYFLGFFIYLMWKRVRNDVWNDLNFLDVNMFFGKSVVKMLFFLSNDKFEIIIFVFILFNFLVFRNFLIFVKLWFWLLLLLFLKGGLVNINFVFLLNLIDLFSNGIFVVLR